MWEAVHQVLRSYRKYMDLNETEQAIVERMSSDLYDLFDNDARRLVDLVAAAQAY